ncbi:MAG: VOC family protein, partial [Pseudomonadota bacterium]
PDRIAILEHLPEPEHIPVGFMILTKDDAELHLTLQKSHKAATFNVAHMLVSDAAETYRMCEQHGLRIIKRLQDKDYGLRAFVFADPDGNRIDVGEII